MPNSAGRKLIRPAVFYQPRRFELFNHCANILIDYNSFSSNLGAIIFVGTNCDNSNIQTNSGSFFQELSATQSNQYQASGYSPCHGES
ncbi:hypothetical protein THIOM_000803 [Candidatus Thiomargarita nelsonii]|uniref:Uncharacterized protein n=1 Tax=Candidatus Thiomargarita nelsonii TaxID=1003181 RepID=A0A176S686_9GAMM|nr:hypothetical protein THIOM_000803 [Candidatus Thiomargarita nelsonii]